jgi:hypothetical protein
MLSGVNPESFDRRLAALESKERQFNTDIIRLWQLYGNLVYKNQTNQPGGNFSPSSTSSPSSSPPPSSSPWPPPCPDGDCEPVTGVSCCAGWSWYGEDGWQCISSTGCIVGSCGYTVDVCTGEIRHPISLELIATCTPASPPSQDGEYMFQSCLTEFSICVSCPSSSPGGGSSSSSPGGGGDPECDPGFTTCGTPCGWIWSGTWEQDMGAGDCTPCECQGKPDDFLDPGSFMGETREGVCCESV